jgi:quercetin dioxygenase-like cupin family protein
LDDHVPRKEATVKRTAFMLGLTLAVGIALGMMGTQVLNAQQKETIKRTLLLKTDLQGIEGQEAHVMMVEVTPGARSGKHFHPGSVLAYMLSGSGALELEGMPAKAIKPGMAWLVPAKQVHEDVAGPSGEKILAVFIIPKGQPLTVPVK